MLHSAIHPSEPIAFEPLVYVIVLTNPMDRK